MRFKFSVNSSNESFVVGLAKQEDNKQSDRRQFQVLSRPLGPKENPKKNSPATMSTKSVQHQKPRARRRSLKRLLTCKWKLNNNDINNMNYKCKVPRDSRVGKVLALALTLAVHLILCDIHQSQVAAFEESPATLELPKESPESNHEQFLEEPSDQLALVGQPVDLACNLRERSLNLSWFRGSYWMGTGGLMSSFVGRYSLPVQEQVAGNLSSDAFATNYKLRVLSVGLGDEAAFRCVIRKVSSRWAKVTVIQPPTRLTINSSLEPESGSEWPNGQVDSDSDSDSNSDSTLASNSASVSVIDSGEAKNDDYDSIRVLTVRQNSRLRLECRTDLAKPQAELFWLDHQQLKVPKFDANSYADDANPTSNVTSFSKEFIRLDANQPKLASTSLSWTFNVQRHHNNKILTCLAKHMAFEQKSIFPKLYGRELKRQVRLEVHYKPDVRLTKDQQSHLYENKPVRFNCQADARPNELTYRWFIDDQLIANATEAELQITRVTRQLHSRVVKCEASNIIGATTDTIRLSVRYSPSFVTHLLSPSLQPQQTDHLDDELYPSRQRAQGLHLSSSFEDVRDERVGGRETPNAKHNRHYSNLPLPRESELLLARQLAHGFNDDDDIQLRCDFDSNPHPMQIEWYKINTDYGTMTGVNPEESTHLIEHGAVNAFFIDKNLPVNQQPLSESRNRRHIWSSFNSGHTVRGSPSEPRNFAHLVNYELMSRDILNEFNLTKVAADSSNSRAQPLTGQSMATNELSQSSSIQQIPAPAPVHATPLIHEPISWHVVQSVNSNMKPLELNQRLSQSFAVLSSYSLSQDSSSDVSLQDYILPTLVLESPTSANRSMNLPSRLNQRKATLTSSTISIHKANEESIGKYICVARPANQDEKFEPLARAIYLVKRSRPRIISLQDQFASIGSYILQVECIAQINAVIDNQTSIRWSRILDGKEYDVMQKFHQDQEAGRVGANSKSFSIVDERSPDLLFMRSKLRIHNPDPSDFGLYNCTIINSLESDHLVIQLRHKNNQPGTTFTVLVFLTIGAVLVITSICSFIIIFAPAARLRHSDKIQKLNLQVNANGKLSSGSQKKLNDDSNGQDSGQESDRKSSDSGHEEGSLSDLPSPPQSQQHHLPQVDHNKLLLAGLADQSVRSHLFPTMSTPPQSTIDVTDSSSLGRIHFDSSPARHSLRSSLRHNQTNNNNSMSLQRSAKFAAIHESLEHKLQLRQTSSRVNQSHQQPNGVSMINDQSPDNFDTSNEQILAKFNDPKGNSMLSRFWSKINNKPATHTTANRSPKARPTISMPIAGSQQLSGSASLLAKSPLGASLSMFGHTAVTSTTSMSTSGQQLDKSRPTCNQHLVSSSANLIQESATSSEGTASSGRSSSQSNTRFNHPVEMINQSHQMSLASYAANNMMNQNYWVQAPDGHQIQMCPTSQAEYLANQTTYQVPVIDTQSYNSHLYSNSPMNYTSNLQNQSNQQRVSMMNSAYPNEQPVNAWIEVGGNQQIPNDGLDQYPMPILVSDALGSTSCFQPPVVQDIQCYDGIYGKMVSLDGSPNMTLANMSVCQPMIPTSDGDDAHFESNYGTYLSKSSAYKSLGYGNQSLVHQSASSSPNSMTTHANNSTTNEMHMETKHINTFVQSKSNGNSCAKTTIGSSSQMSKANSLATHV